MKPIVRIKDCYFFTDSKGMKKLSGIVIDYPSAHRASPACLENGDRVNTSAVIKQIGDLVETYRTIYDVQNWVEEYQ